MFSERVKGREYNYTVDLDINNLIPQIPSYFDNTLHSTEEYSKVEKGELGVSIPVEIFKEGNSGLKAIVKFLKEKKYSYSEIARLLNRDQRTIWSSYNSIKVKKISKIKHPEININSSFFKNRNLSVLEVLTSALIQKKLSLKQISVLVGRSSKTIWTAKKRAEEKRRKIKQ